MDKIIEQLINQYKGVDNEPLDGDEVDDLCEIIKAKINLNEGNITNREYARLLEKFPQKR